MNSLSIVVFCVAVVCASASVHGGWLGHGGSVVLAAPSAHGAVIAGPGNIGAGWLGNGAGWLGHGLVGSGIEGQWIPDINEHLYDDGSYKPHIYGH